MDALAVGWSELLGDFYLHLLGKGFDLERVCDFTGTVFGPGFLVVRTGLHFVLVAIIFSYLIVMIIRCKDGG